MLFQPLEPIKTEVTAGDENDSHVDRDQMSRKDKANELLMEEKDSGQEMLNIEVKMEVDEEYNEGKQATDSERDAIRDNQIKETVARVNRDRDSTENLEDHIGMDGKKSNSTGEENVEINENQGKEIERRTDEMDTIHETNMEAIEENIDQGEMDKTKLDGISTPVGNVLNEEMDTRSELEKVLLGLNSLNREGDKTSERGDQVPDKTSDIASVDKTNELIKEIGKTNELNVKALDKTSDLIDKLPGKARLELKSINEEECYERLYARLIDNAEADKTSELDEDEGNKIHL